VCEAAEELVDQRNSFDWSCVSPGLLGGTAGLSSSADAQADAEAAFGKRLTLLDKPAVPPSNQLR